MRHFKDGCGGSVLESQNIFDRGFERVVRSTTPSGSSSEFLHDSFGRPIEIYLPNPDVLVGAQKPVLATTITYADGNPLSYVEVRQIVGPGTSTRSVTILNGLRESVVAFDQGDNNDWVLNGWRETNVSGKVEKVRGPWPFTGDPLAVAASAAYLSVPWDSLLWEMRYDRFGREVSKKESGPAFSRELLRTSVVSKN